MNKRKNNLTRAQIQGEIQALNSRREQKEKVFLRNVARYDREIRRLHNILDSRERAAITQQRRRAQRKAEKYYPGIQEPIGFSDFLSESKKAAHLFEGNPSVSIVFREKTIDRGETSYPLIICGAEVGNGKAYVAFIGKKVVGHLNFEPSRHPGSANCFHSATILGKKFEMEQWGQERPFTTWLTEVKRWVK